MRARQRWPTARLLLLLLTVLAYAAVESDVAEVKAQIGACCELLRRLPASADAPAAATAMPNVELTTIFDEAGLESEGLQGVKFCKGTAVDAFVKANPDSMIQRLPRAAAGMPRR